MTTPDQSSARQRSSELSPGLRFLLAAQAAMPRTLGDRERIAAMGDALEIALRCRMIFGRREGGHLARLGVRTCVGVFDPLDERWYSRACCQGGTYAALWEAYHRHSSWIAPDLFVGHDVHDQARNNRVAPNVALLLPDSGDDDPDRPVLAGTLEVWWCTSLDRAADTITLCRYRLPPDRRNPLTRAGPPRRRRVLDRLAWAALFPPPSSRSTRSAGAPVEASP